MVSEGGIAQNGERIKVGGQGCHEVVFDFVEAIIAVAA